MASEYTTNRRYPLYTDQDKPNLRDQYNGAIRMIDGDMDDALDASGHVSDALGAGFDAQHTVRMALDDANAKFGSGISSSSTVTDQLNNKAASSALQTEAQDRQTADTALSNRLGSGVTEQNTATTQFAAVAQALNGKASVQSVSNLGMQIVKMRHSIRNKKIVVIGDSLSYSATGYASTHWWQYLQSKFGCTCYNFAVGGTGFTMGNPTFYSQLLNAHNSSDFEDDDITDVIIMGGLNDFEASLNSIYSAVTTAIAYARTTFSNAEIHFGAMLKGTNALGRIHAQSPAQITPMIETAQLNGATIIQAPWTWLNGRMSFDYGDGIHVKNGGQENIAAYVASHLMGGSTLRIDIGRNLTYRDDFLQYVDTSQPQEVLADITGLTFDIHGQFSFKAMSNPFTASNVTLVDLPAYYFTSLSENKTQPVVPCAIPQTVNVSDPNAPFFSVPRLFLGSTGIGGQFLHYIRMTTEYPSIDVHFAFTGIPYGI